MKPTYYATDHVIINECDKCHRFDIPVVFCEDEDGVVWCFCQECSDRLAFIGKLEVAE